MEKLEIKAEIQTIEEIQERLNRHSQKIIPISVEAYCPHCNGRKLVRFIGCSNGIMRMFSIDYNCECGDTISKIIYGNVEDYEIEK